MNGQGRAMRSAMAALVALTLVVAARAQDAPAAAGRRIALVVGNDAYAGDPLVSPVRDAGDMAAVLVAAGFTLVGGGPVTDAKKQQFERAIEEFGRLAEGADAAVFYYSGHGMEWDEQNWMIPVDDHDSVLENTPEVDVSVNHVLQQITQAKPRISLVILDACRQDLQHARLEHAGGALGAMLAPDNTVIAFATQPGDYSYDGAQGGNSAYTEQLLRIIKMPGLELFQVFNRAAVATRQASDGKQRPWTNYSPISGEFYFFAPGSTPQVAATPPPAALPDSPAQPPAVNQENDPSFTLVNISGATIKDLRVSMSGDPNWGENRAEAHPIRTGARLGIDLPAGACLVETRVTLGDGKQITSKNDTCAITTLVANADGTVEPSNPNFSLLNGTGRAIRELHVSLSVEHDWGANLAPQPLRAGQKVDVELTQGMGCEVDVKATLSNGATIERRKVETCSRDAWTLE